MFRADSGWKYLFLEIFRFPSSWSKVLIDYLVYEVQITL